MFLTHQPNPHHACVCVCLSHTRYLKYFIVKVDQIPSFFNPTSCAVDESRSQLMQMEQMPGASRHELQECAPLHWLTWAPIRSAEN